MRVLLIGETWVTAETHVKGAISYGTASSANAAGPLIDALTSRGHEVVHLGNDVALAEVPRTHEATSAYDVVILSDVGADNLLLHPDTVVGAQRTGDFLSLLRDAVSEGQGLIMVGGWMSFSGLEGKARYYGTPVKDILPVTMVGWDDRNETPAGVTPRVVGDSEILRDLPDEWPWFLGYNRVSAKPGAQTLVSFEEDPLLVVGEFGAGRSAAFTSDCVPHWGGDFVAWDGYTAFWDQLVTWVGANARSDSDSDVAP